MSPIFTYRPSTLVSIISAWISKIEPQNITVTADGEEPAWRMACQLHSREAYSSFLNTYPDSSHVVQARDAMGAFDKVT